MKLYYENNRGEQIDLVNSPDFALISESGLGSLPQNNLSTVETVLTEGDRVTYRTRSSRQVILTHEFMGDSRASRRRVSRILDQGSTGKLIYRDDELYCYLPVEVETHEVILSDFPVTMTTTFIGSFPYFRDFDSQAIVNKAVTGAWTFPFTFPMKFGSAATNNSLIIENSGDFEIGFVVIFEARGGSVVTPAIKNHKGEELAFAEHVTTLLDGESFEISTVPGNKYVIKHASVEDENVVMRLKDASSFFPLYQGKNVLAPSCISGVQFMDVSVKFENVYKTV